jgi:TonB family protein
MDTTQALTNIITYAVQIGLLVGIGAALPALLRLKSPAARLLYWQLLLVACLALPWLRTWRSEVVAVSNAPVVLTQLAALSVASAPVRVAIPSSGELALWLLALGVAVRLIWLAAGLLKLAGYRRHGHAIPLPPEWKAVASHTSLLISDEISGPVTFGFFRPVVLLPAGFPAMPEAMRDAILFHELMHVERRDWLFTFGEELLRAVFWFHPAIWWVLGEIQLAREQTVDQAVIEMTQARDPYVDTLLAMAGVNRQLDLAPAPLFLRRRHLKQRVMGIVQEVGVGKKKMSKTRLILAQAAALAMMAVACWFITGAVPLRAQAQMVADGAGVTVNLNGSQLMHRTPVSYPAEAIAKGVEGTVVVQVRLDSSGEVIDAAVLSGPDELRKGVQQSVLNWHFDSHAGSATRVVNIDFAKPAIAAVLPAAVAPVATRAQVVGISAVPGGRGGAPAPQNPQATQQATQQSSEQLYVFMQQQIAQMEQRVSQTNDPGDAALLAQLRTKLDQFKEANAGRLPMAAPSGTIERIDVRGLSDSATAQLQSQLPVHAGDAYSPETLRDVARIAHQFDEHLTVSTTGNGSGAYTIRIATPESGSMVTNTPSAALPNPGPAGAAHIGGNVMAVNLINPVKPIYPPLAKMARQQGTVKFQATIDKEGKVEDLMLISGPPLLVQSAMDAVRQWVYRPTMLNGAPVEVVTTIDVNYSLSDGGFTPPAQ